MNKIGIYKITNPKGAVYIGESKDIESRWNRDYRNLRCKAQRKLYNSFITYGLENHTFEIIKECKSEEIPYYERHYQEYYNVLDKEYGLNLKYTSVGSKKGIHSEETRKKMSENSKGKNKGIKRSEETKKKQSESKIGNKYNLGRVHSEESKQKISKSHKGKKMSEESRKKMIENSKDKNLGIKRSEETKKKISETRKKLYESGFLKPKSKKVINIETNEVYNSIGEICRILGLKNSTISMKLSGTRKNNTPFRYLDTIQ